MDSVIRGVAIYLILMVLTRLTGRRTMAQTSSTSNVRASSGWHMQRPVA